MVRTGIIGAGNIGTALLSEARKAGQNVIYVATTSGVYDAHKVRDLPPDSQIKYYLRAHSELKVASSEDYLAPFKELDCAALAIPTLDDGEQATHYLDELLKYIPVSTSEKGALSLNFEHFTDSINDGRLGYRAAAGGGTCAIPAMRSRITPRFNGRLDMIINGTINYILDGRFNGRSTETLVREVKRLNYAEPGENTPFDVGKAEVCGDLPKKIIVVFNSFMLALDEKDFITINDIMPHITDLTPQMFDDVLDEAKETCVRHVVSIRRTDGRTEKLKYGFSIRHNGWQIEGGFRSIGNNSAYNPLLTHGVDNVMVMEEDNGDTYILAKGPGAGGPPTARAMLLDFDEMIKAGHIKK